MQFSPRCIHGELLMHIDGSLPIRTIVNSTCTSQGCNNSTWQGVGIYCSIHYLACHQIYDLGTKASIPDLSKSFILKAPSFIRNMATEVITWKDTRLEPIFKALPTPHPGCPNVYAVDTEFCSIPGQLNVTEVAVVNMRTNNLVVHGVFNHKRGMVASAKLARLCRLKKVIPTF